MIDTQTRRPRWSPSLLIWNTYKQVQLTRAERHCIRTPRDCNMRSGQVPIPPSLKHPRRKLKKDHSTDNSTSV
ncbi:Uncharacterized protein HZ326_11203 [Fusarium oxysporum f. sp. albedinis]|nr:Uncharacterized protein HZ326_11203 [Fusarium oxysporum f. sp. albedinis]